MAERNEGRRECWLRLGTMAEKDYVLKAGSRFAGMVVNANLVEGCPGATAALAFAANKRGIGYWIDPYTYPFAENARFLQSSGKRSPQVKRTFRKLALEYGSPLDARIENCQSVETKDFDGVALMHGFCQRVLEYQTTRLAQVFEQDAEMRDFAQGIPAPQFLVAPYFFMGHSLKWRDVNLAVGHAFVDAARPSALRVLMPLCFAEELLDDENTLDGVAADWRSVDCSGYLIWISDLVEKDISRYRLRALRRLCSQLAGDGRLVINSHGGYLSGLLFESGMSGFAHGIGYGEHRDVVPVIGGGPPPAKYYYPPLHQMLHPAQVETFFRALGIDDAWSFHSTVCDCSICRGVLNGDLFGFEQYGETRPSSTGRANVATPAAIKKCRFHYLLARLAELEDLERTALETVVERLLDTEARYQEEAVLASVSYLRTWALGLRDAPW